MRTHSCPPRRKPILICLVERDNFSRREMIPVPLSHPRNAPPPPSLSSGNSSRIILRSCVSHGRRWGFALCLGAKPRILPRPPLPELCETGSRRCIPAGWAGRNILARGANVRRFARSRCSSSPSPAFAAPWLYSGPGSGKCIAHTLTGPIPFPNLPTALPFLPCPQYGIGTCGTAFT